MNAARWSPCSQMVSLGKGSRRTRSSRLAAIQSHLRRNQLELPGVRAHFIVVDFPTANASWAYDLLTGYWPSVVSGCRPMAPTSWTGRSATPLPLECIWSATGPRERSISSFPVLYRLGNAIRGYRRSPTLSIENKWIYFPQIEFDAEVGFGVSSQDAALWKAVQGSPPLIDGDGNARPPQLMLRWSDDAGNTWSNTYPLISPPEITACG